MSHGDEFWYIKWHKEQIMAVDDSAYHPVLLDPHLLKLGKQNFLICQSAFNLHINMH